MPIQKTLSGAISILCVLASLASAEDGPAVRPSKVDDKAGDRITKVVTVDEDGIIRTKIFIQLQHPPDSMEPVAEPRRIQVDDRANVQLVVRNVSPLDVCTLNGRTPAATVETNVAESVVGTIAKLAPFSIAPAAENLASPSQLMLDTLNSQITNELALASRPHPLPQRECNVEADPEYIRLVNLAKDFNGKAQALVIGTFDVTKCDKSQLTAPTEFRLDGQEQREDQQQLADKKQLAGEKEKPLLSQAELACQIDAANSKLNDFVGKDYRGAEQAKFDIHSSDLDYVKLWYGTPIPTVAASGNLQAMVDEMATWQSDLHKKYDFPTPSSDSGAPSQAALPPVKGMPVISAAPGSLSFVYTKAGPPPSSQTIQVGSGNLPAQFVVSAPDKPWLRVAPPCPTSQPCRTGTVDFSSLKVSVDPRALPESGKDSDSFTITGAGGALGTVVIKVSVKPPFEPSSCDTEALSRIDAIVDRAKAVMGLIGTNNTTLQSAQGTLKTNYSSLVRVADDLQRRKDQKIVVRDGEVLVQKFNLGTDRKATITGNIACVSDVDGKTATTDPINYSILYQDVPHWSASAGLLVSFQPKRTYGVISQNAGSQQQNVVAITDQAPAQAIPMAFVNYRLTPYSFKYDDRMLHFGRNREETLVWTAHLTTGMGINPNNGANQPEFFLGLALGFNRFLIHPGVHFGRMQSLGGGFTPGTAVGSGITPPINWSYHAAFSIGFSVRVAPY